MKNIFFIGDIFVTIYYDGL